MIEEFRCCFCDLPEDFGANGPSEVGGVGEGGVSFVELRDTEADASGQWAVWAEKELEDEYLVFKVVEDAVDNWRDDRSAAFCSLDVVSCVESRKLPSARSS